VLHRICSGWYSETLAARAPPGSAEVDEGVLVILKAYAVEKLAKTNKATDLTVNSCKTEIACHGLNLIHNP
jgi:hypothetical protein